MGKKDMKLSIITPVLNSHEIVRRQLLHYAKMNLPDDVEVVIIDDGSEPPLDYSGMDLGFFLADGQTDDYRPWTEHIARNLGAKKARGEYLFIIDVDYIIPKKTIESILNFNGDRMDIKRRFGILNKNGDLVYNKRTLKKWGLKKKYLRSKFFSGHRSQFVIRKELFEKMGGYKESLAGKAHPLGGGAGQKFFHKWKRWESKGWVSTSTEKANVFMFPIGKFCGDIDHNPFGLFHDLSRL